MISVGVLGRAGAEGMFLCQCLPTKCFTGATERFICTASHYGLSNGIGGGYNTAQCEISGEKMVDVKDYKVVRR